MSPPFLAPRLAIELTDENDPELADGSTWEAMALSGDATGGTVEDVEIMRSHATSLRLTGMHLVRPRITDCRFERCELSGVIVEEAVLERVEFADCRLSGAMFPDVRLRHVRFVGCRMDAVAFRMAVASQARFESCLLLGADLYASDFAGTVFADCDLTGSDLSRSRLTGARLHGSDLTDIVGSAALRDVEIDSGQIVPMALAVFDGLGIRITER